MATISEIYQLTLQNRTSINAIKDKAKTSTEFQDAGALLDTDILRVVRGSDSFKTTVGAVKAISGSGDLNVQSDWSQANALADDFIKNKPVNLSDFNNDIGIGGGDMLKAIYDSDNNGVVDDAERLNGQLPSFYDQNAHVANNDLHVDATLKAALSGANGPSNLNVFATMADVDNLTTDEKNAIQAANVPSALNPFATVDDIVGGTIYDTDGRWAKYPGNVLLSPQTNDIKYNFWESATLFVRAAQFNGGDDTNISNYTILDSIEF